MPGMIQYVGRSPLMSAVIQEWGQAQATRAKPHTTLLCTLQFESKPQVLRSVAMSDTALFTLHARVLQCHGGVSVGIIVTDNCVCSVKLPRPYTGQKR
jgi:hypothetical protein